jgi:hypothetical protein
VTPDTTMLEAALFYLANGWSVLPICHPVLGTGRCAEHRPGKHGSGEAGKRPLVYWRLYQDRLPTEAEVRNWWRRWSQANIGLVTGERSGVAVIDLDGGGAVKEVDRRGYLPGLWATTGRVGGRHLYFAWRDDAPTIFAKANGIDYRGQGGYVLLPPSLHRNGPRYMWGKAPFRGDPLPPLPRWVNDLAAEGRGPNGMAGVVLGDILEHTRNETLLSFGGSMRRRGMSQQAIEAALLVENASRCKPPLDPDEVRKIAASVARYQPAVEQPDANPPSNLFQRLRGGRVIWPLERPRAVTVAGPA